MLTNGSLPVSPSINDNNTVSLNSVEGSMAKRSLQRSEMDYREFRKEDDVEFANASTF